MGGGVGWGTRSCQLDGAAPIGYGIIVGLLGGDHHSNPHGMDGCSRGGVECHPSDTCSPPSPHQHPTGWGWIGLDPSMSHMACCDSTMSLLPTWLDGDTDRFSLCDSLQQLALECEVGEGMPSSRESGPLSGSIMPLFVQVAAELVVDGLC